MRPAPTTPMIRSRAASLHLACLVVAGVCWTGALGALRPPGRIQAGEPAGDLALSGA